MSDTEGIRPFGVDHASVNSWGDPDATRAMQDAFQAMHGSSSTVTLGGYTMYQSGVTTVLNQGSIVDTEEDEDAIPVPAEFITEVGERAWVGEHTGEGGHDGRVQASGTDRSYVEQFLRNLCVERGCAWTGITRVPDAPQPPAEGENGRWQLLGRVCVDSASLGIVDPGYVSLGDTPHNLGEATRADGHEAQSAPWAGNLGVQFWAGFGDGEYEVWGWLVDYESYLDDDGNEVAETRVAQVVVTLIDAAALYLWEHHD